MLQPVISYLADIDNDVMIFLNGFHAPLFDPMMLLITNKWLWISLSVVLVAFMAKARGLRHALIAAACLGIALALCDQICSTLLRPAIERMRPSNLDNPISRYIHVVDGYRSGRFGFPSAHGATTMAVAVFLALYFRRRAFSIGIFSWTAVVCYSRIYLGVHYPGDILCGLIIGAAIAVPCYILYDRLASLHIKLSPPALP